MKGHRHTYFDELLGKGGINLSLFGVVNRSLLSGLGSTSRSSLLEFLSITDTLFLSFSDMFLSTLLLFALFSTLAVTFVVGLGVTDWFTFLSVVFEEFFTGSPFLRLGEVIGELPSELSVLSGSVMRGLGGCFSITAG